VKKIFQFGLFILLSVQIVFGQNIKTIVTYPYNPEFTSSYYISDSVIWLNSRKFPYFLNDQQKLELLKNPGMVYVSPDSKVYHITQDGRWFSIVDLIKHKVETTFDNYIYSNKLVEHFEVVDNKYVLLKFIVDTLFFKINFYPKKTIQQNI